MKKIILASLLFCSFFSYSDIKIASTTSTQNSGFYDYIIPKLEEVIGDEVKVIAVGTGQALKLGENGDVDMLVVHAPDKEKSFVENGFGISRKPFMYNYFFVVGPENDPASIASSKTASEALSSIAKTASQFVSRADNSGTHFKELSLWEAAGITPSGDWYIETGSGMGATLNVAASMDAYTLTDSSTWLKFANKQNIKTLFKEDPILFNQYSIILIPKSRYPSVNDVKAKEISDWLISDEGQAYINGYQLQGEQVFFANYKEN